jgi:hypothetical protein
VTVPVERYPNGSPTGSSSPDAMPDWGGKGALVEAHLGGRNSAPASETHITFCVLRGGGDHRLVNVSRGGRFRRLRECKLTHRC